MKKKVLSEFSQCRNPIKQWNFNLLLRCPRTKLPVEQANYLLNYWI